MWPQVCIRATRTPRATYSPHPTRTPRATVDWGQPGYADKDKVCRKVPVKEAVQHIAGWARDGCWHCGKVSGTQLWGADRSVFCSVYPVAVLTWQSHHTCRLRLALSKSWRLRVRVSFQYGQLRSICHQRGRQLRAQARPSSAL